MSKTKIHRKGLYTKNEKNQLFLPLNLEKIIETDASVRMNRSIQVEGAFGVLKEDYGFKRFLTRGKTNVTTEMLFLCFAYNINKSHNKTVKKRRKTHLFEKMIA